MAASEPYNGVMATYSCIAVDWGTTNRRAWALGPDGASAAGARRFRRPAGDPGSALRRIRWKPFLGEWLTPGLPVVIAGMAGSRMGWVEVPYLAAPAPLADLAKNLMKAGRIADSDCWIVPGVSFDGRRPAGGDARRGMPDAGRAAAAAPVRRRIPDAGHAFEMGAGRRRQADRVPHLHHRRDVQPAPSIRHAGAIDDGRRR